MRFRGMTPARLSYLIGLATTLLLAGVGLTAPVWGGDRAEDIRAHTVFAGLGAAGALIGHRRTSYGALWVFLVPAIICILAGVRGMAVFWPLLAGYLVAGSLGLWAAWWPRPAASPSQVSQQRPARRDDPDREHNDRG